MSKQYLLPSLMKSGLQAQRMPTIEGKTASCRAEQPAREQRYEQHDASQTLELANTRSILAMVR